MDLNFILMAKANECHQCTGNCGCGAKQNQNTTCHHCNLHLKNLTINNQPLHWH